VVFSAVTCSLEAEGDGAVTSVNLRSNNFPKAMQIASDIARKGKKKQLIETIWGMQY